MVTLSNVPDFTLLGALLAQDDSSNRLSTVQSLTASQFNLIYNAFSFAIAAMFASALFFLNAQAQVAQKYRLALLISAIVVSIAGYHYFRIFNSWDAAYGLQNGVYTLTGTPFNDAYLNMRLLLLFSWGVYPIAYLLPMVGITGTAATVGVQLGYTIADVLAKPLFGLLVFAIAVTKTKVDQESSGSTIEESHAAELDVMPAPAKS